MNIRFFNHINHKEKVAWFISAKSPYYLTSFFFVLMLLLATPWVHAEQKVPQITVYKSPTCGCCNKWVKHLQQNGFKVITHNRTDMPKVKSEVGVKPPYQSCHTALIDGYFIEGHVPAKDIKRLLKEKPNAAGLTVPGMPMGSPGMEGHRKDPYSVLILQKDGSQGVYSQY